MTSVRAIREPSRRDGACRPPTITLGWCGSIAARCGARGSPSSSNPPFFTQAIFRHPVTHPSGLPGIRSVRRIAHRNVRDPFLDVNGCLQPVVPGPGNPPSITRASRPCRDLEVGVVARFGPTAPEVIRSITPKHATSLAPASTIGPSAAAGTAPARSRPGRPGRCGTPADGRPQSRRTRAARTHTVSEPLPAMTGVPTAAGGGVRRSGEAHPVAPGGGRGARGTVGGAGGEAIGAEGPESMAGGTRTTANEAQCPDLRPHCPLHSRVCPIGPSRGGRVRGRRLAAGMRPRIQ